MKFAKGFGILLLLATAAPAAADSLLGVYLEAPFVAQASSDEEPTFFGPTVEIDLRLSVGNEEAERPLQLRRPLLELARWTLLRDGQPLAGESYEIVATAAPEKYTIGQALQGDPRRLDQLEMEVGLRLKLILRERSKEPFPDGFYRLEVGVDTAGVLLPDGQPWVGRGGAGLTVFRVANPVSEADLSRQIVAQANRHILEQNPQGAVEAFERLVQLQPSSRYAWERLGSAQVAAGLYREAVQSFERFGNDDQRDAHSTVPSLMAAAYLATGQPDKAKAALRQIHSEEQAVAEMERIGRMVKQSEERKPTPR